MRNISIDGSRRWDSLMEMAKIGAAAKGGNCRLALTDRDREGRDLFVNCCKDAGYPHMEIVSGGGMRRAAASNPERSGGLR